MHKVFLQLAMPKHNNIGCISIGNEHISSYALSMYHSELLDSRLNTYLSYFRVELESYFLKWDNKQ